MRPICSCIEACGEPEVTHDVIMVAMIHSLICFVMIESDLICCQNNENKECLKKSLIKMGDCGIWRTYIYI